MSGRLSADNGGGNLEIATKEATFGLRRVFRETIDVSSLDGLAIWRASPQGYRVLADGISLATPYGGATASLELALDSDFGNPVIDLSADARLDDVSRAPIYLPKKFLPRYSTSWIVRCWQAVFPRLIFVSVVRCWNSPMTMAKVCFLSALILSVASWTMRRAGRISATHRVGSCSMASRCTAKRTSYPSPEQR